jgi:tetratricopeptide (TPR) repeat protein
MNYLNRQSHSLLLLLSFLLCSILSSCTTQEERQRYAAFIEHADSLNKADQPLPSDSLLRDAANWYDRHGTANERMRAHYLLGRCYHDMGEAPRALECYQHAAEQADTTREDCDLYTLRAIYGQMADLYDASTCLMMKCRL